jgi:hypothetical protein
MTLPFVGVAARRMMPKIASSDASTALAAIECRSIPGAAIYPDRQRDNVKYRVARRWYKENRQVVPIRLTRDIGVASTLADNRSVISKCLEFGLAY